MILSLDEGVEKYSSVVYEIARVLCQVQHQKIKIQTHRTGKAIVQHSAKFYVCQKNPVNSVKRAQKMKEPT
jgi:hypothetical protein